MKSKRMCKFIGYIVIDVVIITAFIAISIIFNALSENEITTNENNTKEEVTYEYETTIETVIETICVSSVETQETKVEVETIIEVESEDETTTEGETEVFKKEIPHYSNDGDLIPVHLQDYIYECLEKYDCTSMYEYLLAIAYRESSGNPNCVTGPDCGLFQYRSYYWEEWCRGCGHEVTDIMDPYAQIEVTVYYTAKRLNKGKSIEEVISDHYTGEGWYEARYVELVMWNYERLVRIK